MRALLNCLAFFAGAGLLTSCSITQGSVVPSTHYVFPNSNITPLGYTSGQVKKFSILLPPRFRARDLDRLYGQAMNKYQGTDLIIDSKVDSKNTSLIIFNFMKVSISGTAAKMEVGKQDIGQPGFNRNNNNGNEVPVVQQNSEQAPINNQSPVTQQTQYQPGNSQAALKELVKDVPKVKKPKKSFRAGVQTAYVNRDFLKPAFGVNAELFLSPNISLAPSVNIFSKQRIDLGFGQGTFEAKQMAIWVDQHYYFVNKQIGAYGLTSVGAEHTSFDKFEVSSHADNTTEVGFGIGIGVSAEFLSGHLVPFIEGRYVALNKPDFVTPYTNSSTARLSWGVKYSFGGNK